MLLVGQKVFVKRDDDEAEAEEAEIRKFTDGGQSVSVRFTSDGYNRKVTSAEVAVRDHEYDAEVLPKLPPLPSQPKSDAKYDFIAQYKAVGNDLFKQGKHEWAIRTYAAATQQLQRQCYETTFDLLHDQRAQSVCVACFSNAALCALKLEQFELASSMCDRGLQFAPVGSELAKLLVRKATAMLDRPEHADPDAAVECLDKALEATAAAEAKEQRPIRLLMQRAKKASKEKQKAADAELRMRLGGGGREGKEGGGGLRLSDPKAEIADARHECEQLLRRGHACLVGTHPDRCSKELLLGKEHTPGYVPPERDAKGAQEAFEAAEACAAAAGLTQELSHAIFGVAAAMSELGAWKECADGFARYLKLADEQTAVERKRRAASGGRQHEHSAAAAASPPRWCEPPLGMCYACFHCGMALYNLRMVEPAISVLLRYLQEARPAFQKLELTTRDAWGNEIITPLDKELMAYREWVACERSECGVRRMLATLFMARARMIESGEGGEGSTEGGRQAEEGGGGKEGALRECVEQLQAMLRLASADEDQIEEAHHDLGQVLQVLGEESEAREHAEKARALKEALEARRKDKERRDAEREEMEERRRAELEDKPLLDQYEEGEFRPGQYRAEAPKGEDAPAVEELIAAVEQEEEEEASGGRVV